MLSNFLPFRLPNIGGIGGFANIPPYASFLLPLARNPPLVHPERMDSRDLTPEQCEKLIEQLTPRYGYICKLITQMQYRHFPHEDPLWQKAYRTRQDMLKLITEVRRASSESRKRN